MKKLISLLILLFFLVSPVLADLYTVRDQEGNIIAITNQNIFKAEYQELGYTFELWLKQTERTPTLDSLVKDWESRIKEPKLNSEKEKAKKEAEAQIEARIKELESQSKTEIKVVDWTNYLSDTGNYYYVEGILKNVGKGIAEYIQVKVITYDKYKKLVSLKESYANPVNLSPGQEATFKIMINYNAKIDSFGLKVNWR
ncbi:hypothetical protein ES705_28302 [subsurface metagenome]